VTDSRIKFNKVYFSSLPHTQDIRFLARTSELYPKQMLHHLGSLSSVGYYHGDNLDKASCSDPLQVVNKIEYSEGGVKVFTEDGSTYSAKAAILSVSLGVLQSKLIAFEPELPVSDLD
jgi:hypothetical protein